MQQRFSSRTLAWSFGTSVEFGDPLPNTFMSPDGGILSILAAEDEHTFPILITEVKNQGTNDVRAAEGLKKQAMGNAIERLGKNVIGFRAMMLDEGIIPFVCFGYGWDFQDGSSILDRVKTIAMFGELNRVNVVPEGEEGLINRGSFYFRQEPWSRGDDRGNGRRRHSCDSLQLRQAWRKSLQDSLTWVFAHTRASMKRRSASPAR